MVPTVRGRCRIELPILGQGTWKMGESPRHRRQEVEALKLGLDLGMNLIDTAEMYADGGAGFVIADESGMESAYETALAYAPYMQFATRPVLTIEDALPTIAAWMSS